MFLWLHITAARAWRKRKREEDCSRADAQWRAAALLGCAALFSGALVPSGAFLALDTGPSTAAEQSCGGSSGAEVSAQRVGVRLCVVQEGREAAARQVAIDGVHLPEVRARAACALRQAGASARPAGGRKRAGLRAAPSRPKRKAPGSRRRTASAGTRSCAARRKPGALREAESSARQLCTSKMFKFRYWH